MAAEFGGRIRLQGENEYRSALGKINSELRLLTNEMGDNAASAEALAKKQDLLRQKTDEQKKHIAELEQALKQAKDKYGENSVEAQKWETKLNNAKNTLISMENELKNTSNGLKQVSENFASTGEKLNNIAGKLSVISTGAVGFLAGLTGISVKAGVTADDLNTLATVTGVNTTELQKFVYASDLVDVSLETYSGSLRKLIKNMQSAQQGSAAQQQAFEALGVTYENTDGTLRNNQDVFYDLIDALGAVDNETQRDAYAMSLFGKSAQDLNPLISAGSDTLKKLGDEAEQAGLILSQDALDGLNQFNDGVDRLKAAATADLSRIGAELAPTLLPILEDANRGLEKVVNWITSLDQSTVEAGMKITAVVAISAPLLKGLGSMVTIGGRLIAVVGGMSNALTTASTAQELLNVAMTANPVGAVITAIVTATTVVGLFVKALYDEATAMSEIEVELQKQEQAYNDNKEAINDTLASRQTELQTIRDIIPRLEELSNKTDRTAQEEEELNGIIKNLNKEFPDLDVAIDETTGTLNTQIAVINDTIDAYERLAVAQAYQQQYQAAVSNKAALEVKKSSSAQRAMELYAQLTLAEQQEYKQIFDKLKNGTELSDAYVNRFFENGLLKLDGNQNLTDFYKALDAYMSSTEAWNKSFKDVNTAKNIYETYTKQNTTNTLPSPTNETPPSQGIIKVSDTSELDEKVKADIDTWEYRYKIGEISLAEYTKQLARIRDAYFVKDSKAWREYNLKILDLQKQGQKANTAQATKNKEYATLKQRSQNWVEDRNFYNDWERFNTTEEESYKRMLARADEYYAKGLLSYEEYASEVREISKSIYTAQANGQTESLQDAKTAYSNQQASSYSWIDERVLRGDFGKYDTNEEASYNRILARAKKAYQADIISFEDYCAEIEKIAEERKNDYTTLKQRSQNWVEDRNFYNDWERFNTTEEESYKRMLARADEYYAKGVLSYEEYASEVREISKSIYTAQTNEQEAVYNQAEERLTQMLADRKAEIDSQISALNKQVSDLRSEYTTKNRNKELSELQAEARIYRNSGTLAGQEKYKNLTDQIEKLQQEAEIEALEKKNNEIIAQLQADYTALESQKQSILEQIANNTASFNADTIINGMGDLLTKTMPQLLQNFVTNNYNSNTNNVTQNNTINDSVDVEAYIGKFLKKLN